MRHGKRRRGLRMPWSAQPSAAAPDWPLGADFPPVPEDVFDPQASQPLRVGPYLPPYQAPRSVEPDLWAAGGTTALVDDPPSWQPYRTDPSGLPPVPAHGRRRSARRWLSVVAVLVALAVAAVAVAGLLHRPPGHTTATTGGTGTAPSAAPAFTPVTIEAEADTATLTGSAQVAAYPGASGGKVVRYIGNWGRAGGPGALRFNGIVVPASGTYVLTLAYVNANMNEATRSVVITASGAGSAVTVVAGGSACCSTQLVKVFLVKGTNSITFANPRGHGPTIDKITVELRP